jgi:hypothetical protein
MPRRLACLPCLPCSPDLANSLHPVQLADAFQDEEHLTCSCAEASFLTRIQAYEAAAAKCRMGEESVLPYFKEGVHSEAVEKLYLLTYGANGSRRQLDRYLPLQEARSKRPNA